MTLYYNNNNITNMFQTITTQSLSGNTKQNILYHIQGDKNVA